MEAQGKRSAANAPKALETMRAAGFELLETYPGKTTDQLRCRCTCGTDITLTLTGIRGSRGKCGALSPRYSTSRCPGRRLTSCAPEGWGIHATGNSALKL
ncbi:hypothetical protein [Streptomyces sp. NPDC005573]|uniref:hypothetical protein n=1 Tax=Streptomyces sp. NPDC005573 TaxID=3156890 RepID=UPI0033A6FCFD